MANECLIDDEEVIVPKVFFEEHINDKCIPTKKVKEVIDEHIAKHNDMIQFWQRKISINDKTRSEQILILKSAIASLKDLKKELRLE